MKPRVHRTGARPLTLPSAPASYLSSARRGIEALRADCELMLSRSALPREVEQAGQLALRAAKAADELRHRVVHDMWLHIVDDESEGASYLQRYQNVKGQIAARAVRSDLDFVNRAEHELARANVRVLALVEVIADGVLGRPQDPGRVPHAELVRAMRGEFELGADGGWRLLEESG